MTVPYLMNCPHQSEGWCLDCLSLERTRIQAEMSASLEAGVRGAEGIYPSWVYEARDAIRHQNERIPWLPDLLAVLGWQGGTIYDALNAVRRLMVTSKGGDDDDDEPGEAPKKKGGKS